MKKIILIVLLNFFILNANAQDTRSWKVSVGAAFALKKNNRVENNYEDMDKKFIVKPIPFITGSIGRFSLGANGLSFKAIGNQMMNVSAYVKRDGDKYNGLNMEPRKESVFAGISGKFFNYGLSLQKDINGRSKGYTTQFSYGEMLSISEEFLLRGGLTLEWFDDKYAEYYYSVRASEATATRPEYHLKNYFQPGLNIMPIWKLTPDISFTTIAGIKFIPKKVRNSPTMNGDKLEIGGLIGASYSF